VSPHLRPTRRIFLFVSKKVDIMVKRLFPYYFSSQPPINSLSRICSWPLGLHTCWEIVSMRSYHPKWHARRQSIKGVDWNRCLRTAWQYDNAPGWFSSVSLSTCVVIRSMNGKQSISWSIAQFLHFDRLRPNRAFEWWRNNWCHISSAQEEIKQRETHQATWQINYPQAT
jgi:hypothetical protein